MRNESLSHRRYPQIMQRSGTLKTGIYSGKMVKMAKAFLQNDSKDPLSMKLKINHSIALYSSQRWFNTVETINSGSFQSLLS